MAKIHSETPFENDIRAMIQGVEARIKPEQPNLRASEEHVHIMFGILCSFLGIWAAEMSGCHEPRRHRSTSNLSYVVLERNKFNFAQGALDSDGHADLWYGCVLICHVHLSIEGPAPWKWRQMHKNHPLSLLSLRLVMVLHGSVTCSTSHH